MVRISSGKKSKQDAGTPDYIFNYFNRIYDFTIDAAATSKNTKCERFFNRRDNGLIQSWKGERVWLNPPYNDVMPWVKKSLHEVLCNKCELVLMFVNNDPTTTWYKELWIYPHLTSYMIIDHRVKFNGYNNCQSVPSVGVLIQKTRNVSNIHDVRIVKPRK